jgi:hypothetical protein
MKLYELKGKNLNHIRSNPFTLEKEIQQIVEHNVDELFGLELVKSELTVGGFRFDTLCFDKENNSFVIIEYKKGTNYSVIDQGYTYLSILLNNKSDFILEYNETKEMNLKRDGIDWSQSRIIFISPKFSEYQKHSINFKNVPFELWEIKRYEGGLVSLNKHTITSTESIDSIYSTHSENNIVESVSREVVVYTEQYHLDKLNDDIKEIYQTLRDKILNWEDVVLGIKRHYISFSYGKKVFLYVNTTKKHLRLEFFKNEFSLKDPNTPFKEFEFKLNTIYSYRLFDESEIDRCLISIKEKYESVK